MNRRELLRRTILGTSVAAAAGTSAPAREIPPDYDASKELAAAGPKPVFLAARQNETPIAISDVVIPETDAAGAKTALVNRFIDKLLAAETREIQRKFLESLTLRRRGLQPLLQGEYRGHAHFQNLKDWISRAYYSSEPGMRALGYTVPPHGEFEGCTHSEGHPVQTRDGSPR